MAKLGLGVQQPADATRAVQRRRRSGIQDCNIDIFEAARCGDILEVQTAISLEPELVTRTDKSGSSVRSDLAWTWWGLAAFLGVI